MLLSPKFNFTQTCGFGLLRLETTSGLAQLRLTVVRTAHFCLDFMVAGIAGINPHEGTLGTATFADFAVQVRCPRKLAATYTDAPSP